MPRVSILLPNLNNRRWLPERLATLAAQTFADWELIVSDNFSDDGAWEFLREAAARDSRLKLAQASREGMYANWNRCVARATGEFVYVATSDDTMEPSCLAKLVAALEAHPACSVAQCCLHAIDEEGRVIDGWWKLVAAARFLGDWYLRPHLRWPPVDGILHCGLGTVYHSITQVLVRREVFATAGLFSNDYGSAGDFHWGLRVGLRCAVVHVPEFLATWRIHADQASGHYRPDAAERALTLRMANSALDGFDARAAGAVLPSRRDLLFPCRYERWRRAWAERPGRWRRIPLLASILLDDPPTAWRLLRLRASGRFRSFEPRDYVWDLLRREGLDALLSPL